MNAASEVTRRLRPLIGRRVVFAWTAGAAALLLVVAPAIAQGHRGAPPGLAKKPSSNGGASAPSPVVEVSGATVRTFGTWLDDATLAAPGSVWLSTSLVRWSAPAGSGLYAPAFGMAIGISPRVQGSLSVPYARCPSASVGCVSGFGTAYAGVKVLIRDPSTHAIGVSSAPALEVLDAASAAALDSGRTHMVWPISIEAGGGTLRTYASAGYFTRGATFASAAVERRLSPRVALTGALSHSHATSDALDAALLGLSRNRTDIYGGVTAFVAPTAAVFVNLGRTISQQDFDSARFVLTAGLSVGMMPSPRTPPRPPR